MALSGVHACLMGANHADPKCSNAPLTVRGISRCRCRAGFTRNDFYGDCLTCKAGYYETDADFRAEIPALGKCAGDGTNEMGDDCNGYANTESPCKTCCEHNSAGLGYEFPITLTVTTKEGKAVIPNIMESSIAIEERKGIPTLVCEESESGRIMYFPFTVWYMTEMQ